MDTQDCTQKFCPKCNTTKPTTEFNKHARKHDGLQFWCRDCCRARKSGWRLENRKHTLEYQKEYLKNTDYQRKWIAKNPGYHKERLRIRRAWESGGDRIDRMVVFERDNGTCYLCGLPIPIEDFNTDHVVPLCRNGAHTYDNVRATHQKCNYAKSTLLLEELETYGVTFPPA